MTGNTNARGHLSGLSIVVRHTCQLFSPVVIFVIRALFILFTYLEFSKFFVSCSRHIQAHIKRTSSVSFGFRMLLTYSESVHTKRTCLLIFNATCQKQKDRHSFSYSTPLLVKLVHEHTK